jgi:hypothetical protein
MTTRTLSSSTCSGARTSERRSPSSPDHQPGSQHAPGQHQDPGGQVEEHRGRQGQQVQELAAKLGAEKEKVENNEVLTEDNGEEVGEDVALNMHLSPSPSSPAEKREKK